MPRRERFGAIVDLRGSGEVACPAVRQAFADQLCVQQHLIVKRDQQGRPAIANRPAQEGKEMIARRQPQLIRARSLKRRIG